MNNQYKISDIINSKLNVIKMEYKETINLNCIYAIKKLDNENTILYIGQTTNLFKRMNEHCDNIQNLSKRNQPNTKYKTLQWLIKNNNNDLYFTIIKNFGYKRQPQKFLLNEEKEQIQINKPLLNNSEHNAKLLFSKNISDWLLVIYNCCDEIDIVPWYRNWLKLKKLEKTNENLFTNEEKIPFLIYYLRDIKKINLLDNNNLIKFEILPNYINEAKLYYNNVQNAIKQIQIINNKYKLSYSDNSYYFNYILNLD